MKKQYKPRVIMAQSLIRYPTTNIATYCLLYLYLTSVLQMFYHLIKGIATLSIGLSLSIAHYLFEYISINHLIPINIGTFTYLNIGIEVIILSAAFYIIYGITQGVLLPIKYYPKITKRIDNFLFENYTHKLDYKLTRRFKK